jgi:uncharacterized protein YukE
MGVRLALENAASDTVGAVTLVRGATPAREEGIVPKHVSVTTDDLRVSAATVDAHADDVQAKHLSADSRVEAAQRGVPTGSAAALGSAVTKWQADTSKLFGRMIDHADGLRAGAAAYQMTDSNSASEIENAGRATPELDLGL